MRRPGVRLSGGRWRGRKLEAAAGVRPTESRVREALASIWAPRVEGARVLDLFAGSGGVGLELLSRGAATAVLVDKAPKVLDALRRNIAALGAEQARVLRLDLPRGAVRLDPGFDLIFADPPYAFDHHDLLLTAVAPLAVAGAALVVEHGAQRDLEAELDLSGGAAGAGGWCLHDRRRYGDCALSSFTRT